MLIRRRCLTLVHHRIWIFQAFFRSELGNHKDAAHELYNNALDVLHWGREIWANVPKEDRGVIFERSFIRGVKRLKLLNMHKVWPVIELPRAIK